MSILKKETSKDVPTKQLAAYSLQLNNNGLKLVAFGLKPI